MKHTLIVAIVVAAAFVGLFYFTDVFAPTETTEPVVVAEPGAPTEDSTPTEDTAPTDYVGLTVAEAEAFAAANEEIFRVVEQDGEALMVTEDWRPGRINATVEDGIVTSYSIEGEGMSDSSGEPTDEMSDESVDDSEPAGAHDTIIGMTEAEAEAYADAEGVPFRVGARDGEVLPVTMDYRPGRITAQIEDGVVTGYSVE